MKTGSLAAEALLPSSFAAETVPCNQAFALPMPPAPAIDRRGTPTRAKLGWLKSLIIEGIERADQRPSRLVAGALRLLGFDELKRLLSQIDFGEHLDRLRALAQAVGVRFKFEGLENLEAIDKRPVILFANHPTGCGNVLGLSMMLANRFPDHRILGNQHMATLRALSQKMIPVDPFSSTAPINIRSLSRLREEFGTQYQALGVFPAGVASRLNIDGTISDRPWSDAFLRIARHHDALMVPVWFSGRNRLRFYIAGRILVDLGYLALPAEFLRLRGQTITARIGKPIDPRMLQTIGDRRTQLRFLRAKVYELAAAAPPGAHPQGNRTSSTSLASRPLMG